MKNPAKTTMPKFRSKLLKQKAALRKASPNGVIAAMTRAQSKTRSTRFIRSNNYYNRNVVSKVDAEHKLSKFKHCDLAEYIAASAPLHAADGWAYLGRAILAALSGDPDVARHLAYYSSLRAAMSILATRGIGVFASHHVVVDSSGSTRAVQFIGRDPRGKRKPEDGTHQFAWNALKYWGSQPHAATELVRSVTVAGHDFDEWLDEYKRQMAATSPVFIGRRWLSEWGIDLRRMAQDRDSRNEASYRPTRLIPKGAAIPQDSLELATEFWNSVEPNGSSTFGDLDIYLARSSFMATYEASVGAHPAEDSLHEARFRDTVLPTIAQFGLSATEEQRLESILADPSPSRTPKLLVWARRREGASHPSHHLSAVSRAMLLLRFATRFSRDLLLASSVSSECVEAWSHELGEHRGFWSAGTPVPLGDMWRDVEDAIEAIGDYIDSLSQPIDWYATTIGDSGESDRGDFERAKMVLAGAERIPMWSFSL